MAFGISKLSRFIPRWRKCPYGYLHRITGENPECGHGGKIIEWCEPQEAWVSNPTKTAIAKEMFRDDDEFEVEREARLKLEEAMKSGDIKPALDYRRRIMSR